MRPISNSTTSQVFPDYPDAGPPTAAGPGDTTALVKLPPRVGDVYPFNNPAHEPLTPESYIDGVARGRIPKDPYLDFMLLGVVPKVQLAHRELMQIARQLVDSKEFAALEFLFERCGSIETLTLYFQLLTGEGMKELADILNRTQPGITTLNCQTITLLGPQCSRDLKALVDAFSRLTAIKLGVVDAAAVNELSEAIRSFPNMTELAIDELNIDDEATGQAFCSALKSASAVSALKLGHLTAPDKFKTDLLQCLASPGVSKRTVQLSLNVGVFAAPAHLDLLSDLIRQCPALDCLALDGCSKIEQQIDALCKTLKEAPGKLESIYLKFDWPATKLSKTIISMLTDTARCRTGLRGIFGNHPTTLTSLDKKEFEPWPGHIHEDYGHYKDPAEDIWARFEPCYAPLVDLLERNEALHWSRDGYFHTEDLARVDRPVGPYNLEKDSGSLLARHVLAHSDSVRQFREVMTEIADALKEKNHSKEPQAPTSTASNAPTTNSTQDPKS